MLEQLQAWTRCYLLPIMYSFWNSNYDHINNSNNRKIV